MNIYLLVANERGGRDVFDGFVIIAKTAKDARKIAYNFGYGNEGRITRIDKSKSIISKIGITHNNQKEGIVLSSFCAA